MSIAENQDKSFNVAANISDTLEELGWYYEACPIHRTKVRKPSYFCYKCQANVPKPIPWLNFSLIVTDNTGEGQFSFIGKLAEDLVGSSAQELLNWSKNEGKEYLPPKFSELTNKELLFSVKPERNKFTQGSIYYHVTNIHDVPPPTAQQLPSTPATLYKQSSSESKPKLSATSEMNRTRRPLFIQEPSKKPRTSREGSRKGKEKKD